MKDIAQVLMQLPKSAAGPDGIPFQVYKSTAKMMAPIFSEIINEIIDGSAEVPEDFNWAFFVCLPKTPGGIGPTGARIHDPGDTRPLSIVDASNRILASSFRVALERAVGAWVSEHQRGFIMGRQMLRNVLEIDFAAQKISINSKAGDIVLFDFKAALSSLSHQYLWDAMEAIGIPAQYIKAIKLFYVDNKHKMKVGEISWTVL